MMRQNGWSANRGTAPASSVISTSMEGALGAPTPQAGLHRSARAQARRRRCSRSNTPTCPYGQRSASEERSGVHSEAALQLRASPYGLRGFLLVASCTGRYLARSSDTRYKAEGRWLGRLSCVSISAVQLAISESALGQCVLLRGPSTSKLI
jgi:hypothetical protein